MVVVAHFHNFFYDIVTFLIRPPLYLSMTLHNTIRSILERILIWAKRNQKYWGDIRNTYQRKLDEEKLLSKLRQEAKAKAKTEK